MKIADRIADIVTKVRKCVHFCWIGVWRVQHDTLKTRIIKTLNLSVRAFMDRDLQMKSSALTYSTVLAIVPAFALLFAIGRGFGFQNLLEDELYTIFPAQHQAIEASLVFVDKYLANASGGVFVGVGILILLWTLVSLLSTIEDAFNNVWDVKRARSMYQKFTDYISICLLIPILMVCSSGVSIFMSTIVQTHVQLAFLTPVLNVALEAAPFFLSWIAFSLSFLLIPNTKVKYRYAAIAGVVCAVAFQIVQWLFVSGQIYVTKYNAIYGSFAFLPLLLVWLQLSWLILLFGCGLTYSLQNIFAFNFVGDVSNVSNDYLRKVALVIMSIIVQRFRRRDTPHTLHELSTGYDIPIRLVTRITDTLQSIGLLYKVSLGDDRYGYTPAIEIEHYSVGEFFEAFDRAGDSNFIPRFNSRYNEIIDKVNAWETDAWQNANDMLLKDVNTGSELA